MRSKKIPKSKPGSRRKLPVVVQIPKRDEKVNKFIKEPLKEKEKEEFTYVIKEPFEDNKEVHKAKDQKRKITNKLL